MATKPSKTAVGMVESVIDFVESRDSGLKDMGELFRDLFPTILDTHLAARDRKLAEALAAHPNIQVVDDKGEVMPEKIAMHFIAAAIQRAREEVGE